MHHILVMRTRVDLLPVTLRQLSISAFHRVWIKLGFSVHARARRTPEGFDIRIRYGKDNKIEKASVKVREIVIVAGKQLRPTLVCAGCSKSASKNLYLGTDFRFRCAKCLGVPQWKIRTPMTWDLGEEVKFRRLLKRKVDQDILRFELAALRTLTPEDFFASRPYLVPEWLDHVKPLDAMLHKKLLKLLHSKYRSVMMRRRVQFLSEQESQWLMEQLSKAFERAFVITKKEITWLRKQRENGNRDTSRSAQSDSQPLETDFSSQKMSSDQDTSASDAMVAEGSPVSNAMEEDFIQSVQENKK